jgi:hypothetical protein
VDHYHQLGDEVNEAYVLKAIAAEHLLQGDFSTSLKELLNAFSLHVNHPFSLI